MFWYLWYFFQIFTACKRSCRKVMFSQLSVHRRGSAFPHCHGAGGPPPPLRRQTYLRSRPTRPPRIWSTGRWYTSYWNACVLGVIWWKNILIARPLPLFPVTFIREFWCQDGLFRNTISWECFFEHIKGLQCCCCIPWMQKQQQIFDYLHLRQKFLHDFWPYFCKKKLSIHEPLRP